MRLRTQLASLCFAAVFVSLTALQTPPAYAIDTLVAGGPGGVEFELQCDRRYRDEIMVGVEGNAGAWVDRLRPICVSADSDPNQLAFTWTPSVGESTGGSFQRALCPSTHPIAMGVSFTMTVNEDNDAEFVHMVFVHCTNDGRTIGAIASFNNDTFYSVDASLPNRLFVSDGRDTRALYHAICLPGEIASGLRGRSGLFVDALGLHCQSIESFRENRTHSAMLPVDPRRAVAIQGEVHRDTDLFAH